MPKPTQESVPARHVVMDGNVFHCLHCGQRYAMALPAPTSVFTAACEAFVRLHTFCIDKRTPDDDPDFREVGQ